MSFVAELKRRNVFRVAAASPVAPARNEIVMDPFLESLHDDPRWEQLIAEARL